jgi:hypothetical protein
MRTFLLYDMPYLQMAMKSRTCRRGQVINKFVTHKFVYLLVLLFDLNDLGHFFSVNEFEISLDSFCNTVI